MQDNVNLHILGILKSTFTLDLAHIQQYNKYPKISYTKVVDKMAYANSADPDQTAPSDQTAPEGAV